MNAKIGRYAFLVGAIIAILAGFFQLGDTGVIILVVLGLVVGFINVTGKEVHSFLIATIALMLVGNTIALLPTVGGILAEMVLAFTTFVAGAAIVVALKEIVMTAKEA